MIKTAVIPAGGYGSRMEPITRAVPKPMLAVIRKPVIHYVVQEAIESGINHVVIVTGFRSKVVKDYFSNESEYDRRSYGPDNYFEGVDIEFISQSEPKGLADAILCSENSVSGSPFAVLLADDIIRSKVPGVAQLLKNYTGTHLIGGLKLLKEKMQNYGVLVPKNEGDIFNVSKIVEKPKTDVPAGVAIAGRYLLNYSIFDSLRKAYSMNGIRSNITDALNLELASGRSVTGLKMEGRRFDVGNEDEYKRTLIAAIEEGW